MRLRFVLLTGLIGILAVLTACGGAGGAVSTPPPPPPPPPATLVSILVTPNPMSLPLGSQQQLTATGTYSDQSTKNITSSVAWSVPPNTTAISVSSGGMVTALATGGPVTTTATLGSISGTTLATVTGAALTSIRVAPALEYASYCSAGAPYSCSIAINQVIQWKAYGVFSDSSEQDFTALVNWSSSDDALVTFTFPPGFSPPAGLAWGKAATTTPATVTATDAGTGIFGTAAATVTSATLSSLDVAPDAVSSPIGSNYQFYATGGWTDGSEQDVTTNPALTWTANTANCSGGSAIASVENGASGGLAMGLAVGSANICASAGGLTGFGTLTVTPGTLTQIVVKPATAQIAAGTTQQFTATGVFVNAGISTAIDITASAAWSSSDPVNAPISSLGLASGLHPVSGVTITASSGGVSGTASLTVTAATLQSLVVTPADQHVGENTTLQFNATGGYSDGTVQDLTNLALWTSSNSTVAIVNTGGLVGTGIQGTATISATYAGISGSQLLTVLPATLNNIIILPADVAPGSMCSPFTQPDLTLPTRTRQKVAAWGCYTADSVHYSTNLLIGVSWRIPPNKRNTAMINGSVLRTKNKTGIVPITARFGGVTGTANLIVAGVSSLTVTPNPATVAQGTYIQLRATATLNDSGATEVDVTGSVYWTTSDASIALVSSSGVASGVACAGPPPPAPVTSCPVTVTASFGALAPVTTTLNVTNAVLNSIALSPSSPTTTLDVSVQFTATGTFSDATTEDLTKQVSWASSDISVAVMSASTPGLAVPSGTGSTNITAGLGATASPAQVLLVTAGP